MQQDEGFTLEKYIYTMTLMGFEEEEALLHYKNMCHLLPTAKPREVMWLIHKYATKAINVVITPKATMNANTH